MSKNQIRCGDTVIIKEAQKTKLQEYDLVPHNEANPDSGKISIESSLGLALLGSTEGEQVTVSLPTGQKELQIIEVSSKG